MSDAFSTQKLMGYRSRCGKLKKARPNKDGIQSSKAPKRTRGPLNSDPRFRPRLDVSTDMYVVNTNGPAGSRIQKAWVQTKQDVIDRPAPEASDAIIQLARSGPYTSTDAYNGCLGLWPNRDMEGKLQPGCYHPAYASRKVLALAKPSHHTTHRLPGAVMGRKGAAWMDSDHNAVLFGNSELEEPCEELLSPQEQIQPAPIPNVAGGAEAALTASDRVTASPALTFLGRIPGLLGRIPSLLGFTVSELAYPAAVAGSGDGLTLDVEAEDEEESFLAAPSGPLVIDMQALVQLARQRRPNSRQLRRQKQQVDAQAVEADAEDHDFVLV